MSLIPSFFGNLRSNVFDPFSLDIWDHFESFPFSSTADLLGLKKEEVTVEVEEGGVLQISGEWSKEQEEKNDKWHRVERSSGKFLRRFWLPENANTDQPKAPHLVKRVVIRLHSPQSGRATVTEVVGKEKRVCEEPPPKSKPSYFSPSLSRPRGSRHSSSNKRGSEKSFDDLS
ncbi:Heat shock protein 1 [Forsythia ovata]|uniref:Heat shock protein 1 n=1 Tax=Forsythia ovata TaxID=205694 RepID=A0ABD1WK68_9LAMI